MASRRNFSFSSTWNFFPYINYNKFKGIYVKNHRTRIKDDILPHMVGWGAFPCIGRLTGNKSSIYPTEEWSIRTRTNERRWRIEPMNELRPANRSQARWSRLVRPSARVNRGTNDCEVISESEDGGINIIIHAHWRPSQCKFWMRSDVSVKVEINSLSNRFF